MMYTRFLALATGLGVSFCKMGQAREMLSGQLEPASLESRGEARTGNIDLGVIITLVVWA